MKNLLVISCALALISCGGDSKVTDSNVLSDTTELTQSESSNVLYESAPRNADINLSLTSDADADGSSRLSGTRYSNVRDGRLDTYWSPISLEGSSARISVKWDTPRTISTVVIREHSSAAGNIRNWRLYEHDTGNILASGSGAGTIDFDSITLRKVSLSIDSISGRLRVAEFETYDTSAFPNDPEPNPPVLVSPTDSITSSTTQFVWRDQPEADRFRLYVYDRSIQSRVHLQYYNRTDVCDGTLCQVTPDISLGFSENHKWSVKAYNEIGGSEWSREFFDYEVGAVNQTPIANNDSATLTAGDQITIAVLNNDTDDGLLDQATINIVNQSGSGTATPQSNGTIVYAHSVSAAANTDSFSYTVNDNQGATSNVATVNLSIGALPPGTELELTDLNLSWAGFPLIADDVGNRLFVSLGDNYSSSSALAGALTYTNLPSGYSLAINGASVVSGDQLSVFVQHGDKLAVSVFSSGQLLQSYELVVTNLPLFEIWAAAIVDEPKLPGIWRWANGHAGVDTGVQNLGIEYRGSTSQAFDKKSFGIETRELQDPEESDNVRFFDLRNDDDWIADAAYRDLAIVRNLVSHDIYRDMRSYAYIDTDGTPKGQATIAGGVAEILLNGSYHGIYVVSERVDRKLLGLSKIDVPEDEAGNELWSQVDLNNPDNGTLLFKAQDNNAGFYDVEPVENSFELKYPDPEDLPRFEPLADLVDFVNYSDDATFAAEIGNRVDLESLADFWILRLVTSNRDTFKKNYYIGRNKSQKWFFVPWDFDATFGLRWSGGEDTYSDRFIEPESHRIPGRLIELGVPSFTSLVKNRWQELRADLLTPDAIANRFSGYFNQMGVDQNGLTESARNRNLQRWPGSGNVSSGVFAVGEAAYIEEWLTRRLGNVDAYINALPI